eukprot:COSAG06_NODE_2632_length_6548_cov_2.498992_3_plen_86_part_00
MFQSKLPCPLGRVPAHIVRDDCAPFLVDPRHIRLLIVVKDIACDGKALALQIERYSIPKELVAYRYETTALLLFCFLTLVRVVRS